MTIVDEDVQKVCPHALLVGMWRGVPAVENSLAVSQLHTGLPYDPEIPLPIYTQKERKHTFTHKKAFQWMFIPVFS